MSDPALMKQIRVEKGTGAASAGIGVIGGSIKAETLDATDLLEDGQAVGARINGGVSSNKGHNGGFAVYGQGGQVDGIAIANWNTQKDYKAGDGKKKSDTAASARAASSSRATTTSTTTTASLSASAAKNNTANATCAKNSPSAATATRRATATATASPIPPTSPTKDAASARLATLTATSSTLTTGKKPKAKPCASKRRASTSA